MPTNLSPEPDDSDPFTREIAFKDAERLDVSVNFRDFLGPNLVNHPHIRQWWDPNLSISDFVAFRSVARSHARLFQVDQSLVFNSQARR